jgi:hypothetical protein
MAENKAEKIAGGLAGGIVAVELLETLVVKGILTKGDARGVLRNSIKAIGGSGAVHGPEGRDVLRVLEGLLKDRFPEH